MGKPFSSVLDVLRWYRRVAEHGLDVPLKAHNYRPRVDGNGGCQLDVRIGEAVLLMRRIAAVLATLSARERDIVLGNDARTLGFKSRNTMYKRQHAIRRRLLPAFIEAGLIAADTMIYI